MPISDRLKKRFDLFVDTCCPELRLGNTYLFDSAEVGLAIAENAAFATQSGGFPLVVREKLIADGRWYGPGVGIGFNIQALEQNLGPGWDADNCDWLLCHEIAHLLPRLPLSDAEILMFADEAPAEIADKHTALTRRALKGELAVGWPPWGTSGCHGSEFIRRALHLACRANESGRFEVWVHLLCAGERYGLTGAGLYLAALGGAEGEPRRLAGLSFGEIDTIAPPTEFVALWERDVEHWKSSQLEKGESSCTH